MPFILMLLLSFQVWSQDQSMVRSYGSLDLPGPFFADEFSKSAVTYESVDWRNVRGANWLGPVRNQSNCGSCVAFATISTLEDQLTITSKSLWKRDAFSQEALFTCGKAKCSSGWFVWDAVRTVERLGVVDVACAPYTAGSLGKLSACGTFCEDQAARTFRIKSYIHPRGAAEVKEALKRGPLVTTMSVRAGFDSYSGGIFKSSMYDEILGGHAVELVGFNDLGRYWIIKNSWGELWGEGGHARISYDDASGVGSETYGFVVEPSQEGFESPLEDQYIRGKLMIKGKLNGVSITRKGEVIKTLSCKKSCSMETQNLPDGEYVLKSSESTGRIMTRRITVLNRTSEFQMKLGKPQSYDYSYPQSGRVYYDVSFTGDVFPEAIIMEIKQGHKLIFKRIFRDVLSFNRIGFNTPSIPNGAYEVSFRHRTFEKESSSQSMKLIVKN